MVIIQDVIISDEIFTEYFHCNLDKCKGACCVEGDYGAPLNENEISEIDKNKNIILPYLPTQSQELLKTQSGYTYYKEQKVLGTTCHEDGSCIFLVKTENNISLCGIEKAWREHSISIQKPISCHLYPIRISYGDIQGFEAWNYDRWDICNAACSLGQNMKMPIFKFVKDAIIRLKGQSFYDEMEEASKYFNN